MRIESSPAYLSYGQRATRNLSKDLFKSTLLMTEKKEDKKEGIPEEKKGKLVTVREGAYVRQYLVGEDGSKIFLSETKQAEEETTSTDKYSLASRGLHIMESGMSQNTKKTLNLLNLQMEAGILIIPGKR